MIAVQPPEGKTRLSSRGPSAPSIAPTRQLIGLDALRFIAALLVMAHHLAFASWASGRVRVNYRYLGPYTWFGAIGVEIFFVLSGFIISYSAQNAEPGSFFRNRATRLYPGAFLCATILLIFGLLLARLFHRLDALMAAIGTTSTLSWIYQFAVERRGIHANVAGMRFLEFLHNSHRSQKLMFNHGCFFAIGGLLWLCLYRRFTPLRVALISFFTLGAILEIIDHSGFIQDFYHSAYPVTPAIVVWLLAITFLVLSVRGNALIAEFVGKRGAAIARTLGLLTYPLYLLHQNIGYILIDAMHRHIPDLAALLLTVLIELAGALLLTRYLETPLQRLLRRKLPGSRRNVTVPATTLP